jgi:serine/threonine protein kinase
VNDVATQSDPDRHPVDVIAEQFAERCRRGERPSVSDYANRHPELAEQLREVLPPIALMEKLKNRNRSGSSNSAISHALQLERIGDFKIIRELGRGGMGVVFEATQESLGRHVALKVLSRASLLDPQRVKRFEQEAKAAAGLHHTNIVPVFGVGFDEGLHYYAMQFIEGRTISGVIGSLSGREHPAAPTSGAPSQSTSPPAKAPSEKFPPRGRRYWSWVADVGRQVSDALDYAHRQGVLHRDVKPANLLLDERGNVWITDFGLAKFASLPQNVTQTGDVIGTLQYLAPEGLKSEADARADIYGLGLTLYELLTLTPAFSESNPAALIRKVAETEPTRPRKINPRIPQDLENIILKAIARDPALRYQNSGELAEDFDNFMHDRPINARRAHVLERMWRWGRRNRLVASLASAAVVCAVLAIALGWIAYGSTKRALIEEANRRSASELARKKSDANVELSLKSFEEIFNRLTATGSQPPPPGGGMDPKRTQRESQDAAVLKSILSFYDQFAAQNSTNGQLEVEAARAYRHVGDSYFYLWQDDNADAAYRRSAGMYARLSQADPNSTQYRAGFVEAALKLGVRQKKLTDSDAQTISRAADVAESLIQKEPHNWYFQQLAAEIFLREGQRLAKAGDNTRAESFFHASITAFKSTRPDPMAPRRPGPPPRPLQCTEAWLELSDLLANTHRQPEARAALREGISEMELELRNLPGGESQLADGFLNRMASAAESLGATDVVTRTARLRERQSHSADGPDGPRGDGPRGFPPPNPTGRRGPDGPQHQ